MEVVQLYRVCHGFRQTKGDDYLSLVTTFEVSLIFEASGEVAKIGWSLKPSHQTTKFNQVKIV